jgi:hypothetical protein
MTQWDKVGYTAPEPLGRWCNRLTAKGDVVRAWEPFVRLDPQLFDCVVYLYPDGPSAERRANFGGTGFLLAISTTSGDRCFVVTNRHVIDDGFCTISVNTEYGSTTVLETDERTWSFHQNSDYDVAIHPVMMMPHYKMKFAPMDMLLTEADLENMDVRIGDDVALIGRFIDMDGKQMNTPTARFGHLAQMPGEPIVDDKGRSQPCFLAQVHSLPGFSGSPVFLLQNEFEKNLERSAITLGGTGRQVRVMGVNCGHVTAHSPVYSSGAKMRDMLAAANTGITRVLPAWIIAETINAYIAKNYRVADITRGGFSFGPR